jgi:hypothetical protein
VECRRLKNTSILRAGARRAPAARSKSSASNARAPAPSAPRRARRRTRVRFWRACGSRRVRAAWPSPAPAGAPLASWQRTACVRRTRPFSGPTLTLRAIQRARWGFPTATVLCNSDVDRCRACGVNRERELRRPCAGSNACEGSGPTCLSTRRSQVRSGWFERDPEIGRSCPCRRALRHPGHRGAGRG